MDTQQVCLPSRYFINGSVSNFNCVEKDIGLIDKVVWVDFNKNSLLKGEVITLGIFTDVKKGDYVEWIINVYGDERLVEWALWTAEEGIVWYYSHDDIVISGINNSVNASYNSTYTGSAEGITGGILGNATNYSAPGEYATYTGSLTDNWTIQQWVWLKALPAVEDYTFFDGTNTGFRISNTGMVTPQFQNGAWRTITGNQSINASYWHHIVTSFDNTNDHVMFWVNGVLSNSTTIANGWTSAIRTNTHPRLNTWTHGLIDEEGFWNRTLSPSEISELYNSGLGIPFGGLDPDLDPNVILWTPIDNYNSSNQSITTIGLVTDDLNLVNVSLMINGTINQTNATGINNTNYTFNVVLPDGFYNWTYLAWDNNSQSYNATARNLIIDTIDPAITIDYPINNTRIFTTNSTYNITINFTATDNVGTFSCWYYNGTINISLDCSANSSAEVNSGWNTFIFYVNDSVGHLAYNETMFLINTFSYNISFTDPIIEGEQDAIRFNLTAYNIDNLTAILEYNNTNYTMVEASLNDTYGNFTYTITAPIVSTPTNVSVQVYYDLDGILYNTSNVLNQTVLYITPMVVTNGTCPAGLSPAMYFNFSDAQNLSYMNASVDYNFQFGVSNSTGKVTTGTLTDIPDFYLCINASVSTNYSLGYGEIDYTKDGWSERRWYAFNTARLTNVQANNTLYLLLDASSTSFLVTIQDPTLTAYIGKYTSLLRWYPERNEYKIVEMGITDGKGQTVNKVEIEDVDYRIGVYEPTGELIYLANPIRMVCLVSPCSYLLSVISTTGVEYGNYIGIVGEIVYDTTTEVFSYTYNDPSQTLSLMELNVSRVSGSSETAICTDNSTGFTGILTCNISGQTGLFKATAFRSASPPRILDTKWVDNLTSVFRGTMGLFFIFIIALTLFLIGIYSPIASIILGILSLIPAMFLNVITYPILLSVGIIGGIVIYFMKEGAKQ